MSTPKEEYEKLNTDIKNASNEGSEKAAKKLMINILAPLFLLVFFLIAYIGAYMSLSVPFGDRVEQKINNDCRGITNEFDCIVTYVWFDGEIAESWYDAMSTVNDSLMDIRVKEAEQLLKTLKGLK